MTNGRPAVSGTFRAAAAPEPSNVPLFKLGVIWKNRCRLLGGRHKRGLFHLKRLVQTEAGFTGVIVEHPDGLKRVF